MKNIILIGMMGCGKTTVGGLLARRLGLPLVDTDRLIEAREGCSVSDIFAWDGERYFRSQELAVSQELAGRQGLIVSCGGGLPMQPGAIGVLKSSGLVFWLDRDPGETYDSLDTAGRPLAQGGREDFLARYASRAPVYRRWTDYTIQNRSTAEEAAERIAAIYLEGDKT